MRQGQNTDYWEGLQNLIVLLVLPFINAKFSQEKQLKGGKLQCTKQTGNGNSYLELSNGILE